MLFIEVHRIVLIACDFAGMPICEAFAQIEQKPNIYDVVHVKYYDEVWFSENILGCYSVSVAW